ncbi:MAG TPA: beta-propeller fold lactonase family protein [Candidatus Angelobacter sp.]
MGSQRYGLSCLLLMLLMLGLAGCGSTSVSGALPPASPTPTTTPAPTPSPTPVALAPSRFTYGVISFEAAGGIFGGQINSATGQVIPAAGTPTANVLGQNVVVQLVADPKGRFLYSLNLGASSFGVQIGQAGIGAYQINRSNGLLTPAPGQIIFPVQRLGLMSIEGTGRFLYQPNGSGFDVYSINQATGQLVIMPFTVPAPNVGGFTIASPDGRFLFNAGNGLVEVYGINQGTGQLITATTPIITGGSAGVMAVSADSRFLYVANQIQGTVAVFAIAGNGTLNHVPGSPFATDLFAAGMSLSPDGRFLYITFQNGVESHVKGYAVNPLVGSLTPIPAATVANAASINVDGSGRFAYVAQLQLSTFRIDPATGALTLVSQTLQPVTDIPSNIVVVP